jgi:hypothetical protein
MLHAWERRASVVLTENTKEIGNLVDLRVSDKIILKQLIRELNRRDFVCIARIFAVQSTVIFFPRNSVT